MTELERALVLLGRELDLPAEPDLRSRVRERIERKRRVRRALVFAVALVVVAFGIAFAVPEARSSILRFFHIGAATVERVDTLPAARASDHSPPGSGRRCRDRTPRHAPASRSSSAARRRTRYYAQPGLIATLLAVPRQARPPRRDRGRPGWAHEEARLARARASSPRGSARTVSGSREAGTC